MVATFTPRRDAGGALHLPSHAGMHQVDPSSAIRQLRRSLARSPSKSPTFSILPARGRSPTRNAPYVSSPLSPSRKLPAEQDTNFFVFPSTTPSPFAVPYPPSAKAVRSPLVRRTRSLNSSSPSTCPLNESANQGNANLCRTPAPLAGQENNNMTPSAPQTEGTCNDNVVAEMESPASPPKHSLSVAEKRRS